MFLALYGLALMFGADVTGSINGVVKDASGAVATTVEITVVNVGTNAVYHATMTQPEPTSYADFRLACISSRWNQKASRSSWPMTFGFK